MDFAWVVDALRRGLKVTRKSWPGQRPQYIRITREPGQETIAFVDPDGQTRRWMCSSIDVLATDWEEYVEPKKDTQLRSVTGETIKVTHEELPVWPEVNADGYSRMSKDSDVVIHDGVYRYKKKPAEEEEEEESLDTTYDRDKQHRLEAIALDNGVRQGTTLEMLDTVFDVACQQVPACEDRWSKLKADLHGILIRKWLDEACSKWDQDDQEHDRTANTNHEKED